MLLLNSKDAGADARSFGADGISDFDVFNFGREGKRADGTVVKLAFSLAFAAEPNSPDVRFAACQHHFPENFWNPAFQSHANGAKKVQGVTLVAAEPARYQQFLEVFTSCEVRRDASSIMAQTDNGDITIVPPGSYHQQFGVPARIGQGMTINAVVIDVARLELTEALLVQHGLTPQRHEHRLVLPTDQAHGATLIFEVANKG